MEAHPDRELFLFENIQGHQNAADHVAEFLLPGLTHVGQLPLQGIRRCQCRRPQQVDEVLIRGTEERTSLEIFLEVRRDLWIGRALLQLRIVE